MERLPWTRSLTLESIVYTMRTFLPATVTSECRHTDCRVSPTSGLISCPTAPPNGLATSYQSAAANKSTGSVHEELTNCNYHRRCGSPLQIKPSFRILWRNDLVNWLSNGREKLQKRRRVRLYHITPESLLTCPMIRSAYEDPGERDFAVPAYRIHAERIRATPPIWHCAACCKLRYVHMPKL